jgi:hypothetical protein
MAVVQSHPNSWTSIAFSFANIPHGSPFTLPDLSFDLNRLCVDADPHYCHTCLDKYACFIKTSGRCEKTDEWRLKALA